MIEKLVEADGVKYAEDRGWTVYKWASPGNVGILDRLFMKNAITFAIEYKTTGKKATRKQRDEAVKLKRAGIPCRCFDDVTDARAFIDLMTATAAEDDPFLDLAFLCGDIKSFDP